MVFFWKWRLNISDHSTNRRILHSAIVTKKCEMSYFVTFQNSVRYQNYIAAEELLVVNKHLDHYRRCCVTTTADHNNLIRAVLVQLKTTKGLTSEILRHQISEYMANKVVFFHPIMKGYLRKLKISYNAYIKLRLPRQNMGQWVHVRQRLGECLTLKYQ